MGVEQRAPHFGAWEEHALTLSHETTYMDISRQDCELGDREIRLRLEYSQDGQQCRCRVAGAGPSTEDSREARAIFGSAFPREGPGFGGGRLE